jgi:peptidylprolyl isomerase
LQIESPREIRYNSSFNYSLVEGNTLPQSRHRKRKVRGSARRTQTAGAGLSKRGKIIALVIVLALIVAGAIYLINISRSSPTSSTSTPSVAGFENAITTPSGLKYVDEVEGTGKSPTTGRQVSVHYTGTLTNGTKFDSSHDRGQPYTFPIGRGEVIKGWDEGLMSMKVGGKRKLLIPANLAYGAGGRPPKIPPNSTLLFDLELVDAK